MGLTFATEAELVSAFCQSLDQRGRQKWVAYHETAGFDLLLVQKDTGIQVGIEAKLALNLKVLNQALPRYPWEKQGPDYRGVLVPAGKVQLGLSEIADRVGVKVIALRGSQWDSYHLPDETQCSSHGSNWHPWLPERRCVLPSYVPDVTGGSPAPLQLTEWKIQAIKLMILLERRGFVTRADIKALRLSASRWTQPGGYLRPEAGGYVRGAHTPRFQEQHPINWAQIDADYEKWAPAGCRLEQTAKQDALL